MCLLPQKFYHSNLMPYNLSQTELPCSIWPILSPESMCVKSSAYKISLHMLQGSFLYLLTHVAFSASPSLPTFFKIENLLFIFPSLHSNFLIYDSYFFLLLSPYYYLVYWIFLPLFCFCTCLGTLAWNVNYKRHLHNGPIVGALASEDQESNPLNTSV